MPEISWRANGFAFSGKSEMSGDDRRDVWIFILFVLYLGD